MSGTKHKLDLGEEATPNKKAKPIETVDEKESADGFRIIAMAPTHEVNRLGEIRHVVNKQILKPCVVDGYLQINFYTYGTHRIHRLVALAFVHNPEPDKLIIVNHIDGNRANPCANNLEWTTSGGNTRDAAAKGRIGAGGRAIIQMDPKTKNIIQQFKTTTAAAKHIKCERCTLIAAAKKGHVSKGFLWKFAKEKDNSDFDGEEWRDISVAAGYQVSNFGRVRTRDGKVMALQNMNGYRIISLMIAPETKKTFMIHQLVAIAFLPPPKIGETMVNHLDENRSNNCLTNLEWTTPRGNSVYSLGRAVQKLDPITGEVLERFDCTKDVTSSYTWLKESIRNNTLLKGFKWRFADEVANECN